jgi:hypothetical protein
LRSPDTPCCQARTEATHDENHPLRRRRPRFRGKRRAKRRLKPQEQLVLQCHNYQEVKALHVII